MVSNCVRKDSFLHVFGNSFICKHLLLLFSCLSNVLQPLSLHNYCLDIKIFPLEIGGQMDESTYAMGVGRGS